MDQKKILKEMMWTKTARNSVKCMVEIETLINICKYNILQTCGLCLISPIARDNKNH